MDRITGACTFESISAVDLLDAARTLNGRGGEGIFVEAPGIGPDKPLAWSVSEVKQAAQVAAADTEQFATNAVLNARRALACLVDWYLKRDCFSLCRDAPFRPKQQAKLLQARSLIDDLTASVLERAIQKRNAVEHEYRAPPIDAAEDVVELLRRTIVGLKVESDPSKGPCLFGGIRYGAGSGRDGNYASFYGWSEPCFMLCSFDDPPWLGVLLPECRARAHVRRTFFRETESEILAELLAILEHTFGRIGSYMGSEHWQLLGKESGVVS